MRCKDRVTEYSPAAGRKVEFCTKLDGADDVADGSLGRGFALAPPGLHPMWGVAAGGGAAGLGAIAGGILSEYSSSEYRVYGAAAGTILAGGLMAAFRSTRTAGWCALGSGLAVTAIMGLIQYSTLLEGVDDSLLGLVAARELGITAAKELRAAPVEVLQGGHLGLPVASEVAAPPVEIMAGAFGSAGFGTGIG